MSIPFLRSRVDLEPRRDRLEWRLVGMVCRGDVKAAQAQRDIAADWIAAYAKYCPTSADCPGYRATHGGAE